MMDGMFWKYIRQTLWACIALFVVFKTDLCVDSASDHTYLHLIFCFLIVHATVCKK